MAAAGTRCGACGYDAAGLPGNTCPECGGPIIDHAARESAAGLIEDFRDGRITNDGLEDRWPKTADATVRRCFSDVWCCYCDSREYRLVGKDAPTEPARELLSRWAVFLRSGQAFTDGWDPIRVPAIEIAAWCTGALCGLSCIFVGRTVERLTGMSRFLLLAISISCFVTIYACRRAPYLLRRAGILARTPATGPFHPFRDKLHVEATRRETATGAAAPVVPLGLPEPSENASRP